MEPVKETDVGLGVIEDQEKWLLTNKFFPEKGIVSATFGNRVEASAV